MKSRFQHGQPPRRPQIGITPDLNVQPSGSSFPLYELKVPYADAVLKSGGLPFVLPYTDDASCIEAYLDRVSGILVTGGAFDIPPEAYGEAAREGLGALKSSRTSFETSLMLAALKRNMPVLGICGGMQLLNVVLGGSLYQDIGREVPGAREHEQTQDRSHPHHPVDVKEGTQLAEALGRGPLMVNSTHHQAVKLAGTDVVISALAPDGVVEAIEAPKYGFAVGVQWHPEYLIQNVPNHAGLYKLFIHKARESRR